MYLFLLALWIIFNGRITLEIVLLGAVLAAAVFAFMCRFMDYSIGKEKNILTLAALIGRYVLVLIVEIIRSTLGACRFILVPGAAPQPLICRFTTPLQTDQARALLANSITLTPGTITVSLENGEYTVHCLDRSMAEGLSDSRFVQLLLRMEEVTR